MNEYRISELSVGMKESFSRTITENMMQEFLDITGDENPLHMYDSYAKEKGFDRHICYGMLTASLISTLGGCYLLGRYCLIRGVEIKFVRPVFVDDILTVTGKINKLDTDLRYMEIAVTIRNQNDEKVLRGVLKAGVMDE